MLYQEKKTIATLLSGVLVLAAYTIYVLQKLGTGDLGLETGLKGWASAMLVFIGVGVVATIVILIVFQIINAVVQEVRHEEAEDPSVEDEMDKLIALKATRNSYILVGAGFVASLVLLVLQQSPVIMLNVLFVSFNLGGLCDGFSQLYFYRKGIRNG